MGFGFGPKLPVTTSDEGDGYALTKTAKEAIKQNIKMLILTCPGERVMHPNFGVGLRKFMFRPLIGDTFDKIATRTREQVANYMPYINFDGIYFTTSEEDYTLDDNAIRMRVVYHIPAIGESDSIEIFQTAGELGTGTEYWS